MSFERERRRFGLAFVALFGIMASLAISASIAEAELQKVEAVGTYGIRAGTRNRVSPRDEAVQNAIWEGVSRVALEQIGALATGDAAESFETNEEDPAVLKNALGKDMLPYTRSFRIVQDKGENPVLFAEDPEVSLEYIVVVEMLVDVDRVKAALSKAQLIAVGNGKAAGDPIFIELVGVSRYQDFEAIRSALASEIGATRVDQLGFARDQQLLSVVGPFGPQELAAALARLDGGGWSLEPIGIDEDRRRIRLKGHRNEPIPSE